MDKAELDLNKAAETFVAAKEKRKICSECGGIKTTPAIEREIDKKRDALRLKRAAFRKARDE